MNNERTHWCSRHSDKAWIDVPASSCPWCEIERLRAELRRMTGRQEPGDLMRPFEDCPHINESDGLCGHPKSMTPECHYGADCPRFAEQHAEIERLRAALAEIADAYYENSTSAAKADEMHRIAKETLDVSDE